jgi:hypothetical protein
MTFNISSCSKYRLLLSHFRHNDSSSPSQVAHILLAMVSLAMVLLFLIILTGMLPEPSEPFPA